MPKRSDNEDFPPGEIREAVSALSGEADFIPLLEFEKDVRFFKDTAPVQISVFATGEISWSG